MCQISIAGIFDEIMYKCKWSFFYFCSGQAFVNAVLFRIPFEHLFSLYYNKHTLKTNSNRTTHYGTKPDKNNVKSMPL